MTSHSLPLRFLGEPLLDAGLVACLLYTQKDHPSQLSREDWETWLSTLQEDYEAHWGNTLGVAYTLNGFNNPSWKGDSRSRKIQEIFALAQGKKVPVEEGSDPRPAPGTPCHFYPQEPAVLLAGRDRFPMLTGRATLNFTPKGQGYLPLSCWALGCVLGFLYVAPLISGRFLLVHTLSPPLFMDLLRYLQSKYVLPLFSAAKASEKTKLTLKHPRSRLGEVLEIVLTPNSDSDSDSEVFVPISALYFTNSGQDPDSEIIRYVGAVQQFLKRMQANRYRATWNAFVKGFWVREKKQTTQAKESSQPEALEAQFTSKNLLYEILPELPEAAPKVVRYFFKAHAQRNPSSLRKFARLSAETILAAEDAHSQAAPYQPIWDIVRAFCLQFFPTMTDQKIEKIRGLATKIAELILSELEPKAYQAVLGIGGVNVNSYDRWRGLLLRLLRRYLQAKNELLFDLNTYLELFEEAEEYPRADWRLVRDLVQIALLEELYQKGYFEKNPEARSEIATVSLDEETE